MIRTGCQGWNYDDWVTKPGAMHVFYPVGTKQSEMLALYSRVFDTVEVDSTFYATPKSKTFEAWRDRTPEGFVFALKMPKEITHEHRLAASSYSAAEIFLARAGHLGRKLGPVLIQLPPSFKADRPNAKTLRAFLDFLPDDLAYAVEFRDPDWLVDWTLTELERRGIWLCAVEGEWIERERFFRAMEHSARLPVYIRFMGTRDLARFDRVCRPQEGMFKIWHEQLNKHPGRDAYLYISNLTEGFAPASVNRMRILRGLPASDPGRLEIQNRLFE